MTLLNRHSHGARPLREEHRHHAGELTTIGMHRRQRVGIRRSGALNGDEPRTMTSTHHNPAGTRHNAVQLVAFAPMAKRAIANYPLVSNEGLALPSR